MRQKVYTINDFTFTTHRVAKGGTQGMLKLPNNITVSIVGGDGDIYLYGDGVDTFEVAAWYTDSGMWIRLGDDDDILTYVDKEKLPFILLDLSKK